MKLFLILSFTLSMIFMQSSHPAMLMILILFQTVIICLSTWMLTSTGWFSYIMFLIFVGGLMVLFIYIVSLAANEKFNPKISLPFLVVAPMVVVLTSFFTLESQVKTSKINSLEQNIFLIYSDTLMLITVSTMAYLLFTLIVVVKMASKYEGPLRNLIFSK